MLAAASLAGLCWTVWESSFLTNRLRAFPINYVRVVGAIENLDVGKLQDTVGSTINGGYFSQDLAEIERAVRSFAWVDDVRLTRIWPDTLEIGIREQKAVARWGDKALLNPRGQRFVPEGTDGFSNLPVIYGPPGMEGFLLETMKSLNEKLGREGLSVASLDMSKRRAWIVKLNNGLELCFGRQEPLHGMERFLELVPKLGHESIARLRRVDLRYSNGFAVVWKPETENGSDNQRDKGGPT